MRRAAVHRLASKWIERLGIPADALKVAVGEKEWREAGNQNNLSSHLGRVMDSTWGFGIARYQSRNRDEIANTIVHEIAHILWPNKPHWWIECFAERVAPKIGLKEQRRFVQLGWGYPIAGRYSARYAHEVDELPSRTKCIAMARKRAHRLYGHWQEQKGWISWPRKSTRYSE